MELGVEIGVLSYPCHLPSLRLYHQWRQADDHTYNKMKESPIDLASVLKQMILRVP